MPSVIRNKTGGILIQNSIEKLKALQEKDDRIKKINDSF
jgi:hypothetical protein